MFDLLLLLLNILESVEKMRIKQVEKHDGNCLVLVQIVGWGQ